jgi:hypothetical protein
MLPSAPPKIGHANMSQKSAEFWMVLVYIIWTVVSAIVLVNLLIAMMGQSFQDVYDDSKRYAQMERARVVVSIEEAIAFPMVSSVLPHWMSRMISKAFISGSYATYVRSAEIGVDVQPYDLDDEDNNDAHSTRMDILNAVRENRFRLDALEGLLQLNDSNKANPTVQFHKRGGLSVSTLQPAVAASPSTHANTVVKRASSSHA